MEIELERDRISHPDICRCCLVNNGLWDLTKGYDSTGPVREILADLLRDCFGISLLYLSQKGVSRLICDACVDQLRHANSFRKQVQTAEEKFSKFFKDERGDGEHFVKAVYRKTESDLEHYDDIEKSLESPPPPNIEITPGATDPVGTTIKSQKKLSKAIHRNPASKKAVKTPTEKTGKPKRKIQNTALNRLIRQNTTLILKNSTVVPFKNKRNNNGKYTCFYCETDFFEIKDIRKHVDEAHENIAEDEIMTILKLPAVFTLTKADISLVRCKICNQDQQNLDDLIKHFTDVHKKIYNQLDFNPSHGILAFCLESETPTCHECEKEFPFFRALVAHMIAQHSNNFACDLCDKKFLFKPNLNQHILKCHSEEQTGAKYKCKFCDETFQKSSERQSHMKKIHGHGRFKCVECGATFTEHQQRVRHVVEVHNYKRPLFKCEFCSNVFMTASILSCHIRTHGDNKVHTCDVCGKKMTSRSSLNVHLRTHSGERPYACQFCEKRFKSHGTLTTHERGHLNDKRYVCDVCDAAFIQINCLRRHYTSRHPSCGIDLKSIRAKKNDKAQGLNSLRSLSDKRSQK